MNYTTTNLIIVGSLSVLAASFDEYLILQPILAWQS